MASTAEPYYVTIPLEEYEDIKKSNEKLKKENSELQDRIKRLEKFVEKRRNHGEIRN